MVDNDEIEEIHKIPGDDSDLPDASNTTAASTARMAASTTTAASTTRRTRSSNTMVGRHNVIQNTDTMNNVQDEVTTERAVGTEVATSPVAKNPSPTLNPLPPDAVARASSR